MYSLRKINLLIFIIMTIVLHSYLQLRAYVHWTHYNACISLDLLPRIHLSMHEWDSPAGCVASMPYVSAS